MLANLFQKQDPFVKLSLRNHLFSEAQTAVIRNGGTNVDFLPEHNPTHVLAYTVPRGGGESAPPLSLVLDVAA